MRNKIIQLSPFHYNFCSHCSFLPQLQEEAIVYRKKLQPLKIIFNLTCNFTINELFQYDIVFKTVERLKIRVKTLIFINVKVFKKNALNFYTVFFVFFTFFKNGWTKGDRCSPRIFLRYSGYLFCRSYLGYCFHNRKGDLVRLLIIS